VGGLSVSGGSGGSGSSTSNSVITNSLTSNTSFTIHNSLLPQLPNEIVVAGTTSGTIGTDRFIIFTSPSSIFNVPTGGINCDILMIGGGGSGGNACGGGAGAGACIVAINHFISTAQYTALKLNNKIEIVPLGLMRGRNFNNCFIVADECQNASYEQLKMLITRLGKDSKMVLTGDIGQSDLQRHLQGGFLEMIEQLETIEGIAVARLQFSDIVRNPIIAKILVRLDAYENETTKQ
jgi:phosphate starvation-inducible PhoH-like protein